MSDPLGEPWSDNPNAPKIPPWLYSAEKQNFAGLLLGSIFYGIAITLFFQCMQALLRPVGRAREDIKWGFVVYTGTMFIFLTIFVGTSLDILSISYIDNREFPGIGMTIPPGPLGYQLLLYSKPLNIIGYCMFSLNNCLADGLLLYRCYVIYSKNYWYITFPCLMYLATLAMAVLTNYGLAQPNGVSKSNIVLLHIGISYLSITFAFNIVITLMIVLRLCLHNRSIEKTMGASVRYGEPYLTVVTMMVESCALYAVSLLLYLIPWSTKKYVEYISLLFLSAAQAIGTFLIILRVANKRAFSGDDIDAATITFRSQREFPGGVGAFGGGNAADSIDGSAKTPVELEVGVIRTVEFHRD